jgi:hypothetical protein
MDNEGARRLALEISLKAIDDLNITYRKAMRLHKACCKGGECNTEKLTDYLLGIMGMDEKKRYCYLPCYLPFGEDYELSALVYFSEKNAWGASLLELAGVSYLPAEFREKVDTLRFIYKNCVPCIAKYRGVAKRRLKNMREYHAAE